MRNPKIAVKSDKVMFGILDISVLAFIVLIIMMMFLWGCQHEPIVPVLTATPGDNENGNGNGDTTGYNATPCDPDSVYFENTILPLFISNCAKSGCHDATTHEEDFVFNSFNGIMASGEIEPGDPSEGDIMEVLTETDPDKRMPPPPNDPLSSQQINLIATWISQGAVNNSCSGECDTVNVTFSGKIAPLLQAKCVGCHNNTTTSGGINLSSYAGVQVQALNGRLLAAVSHTPGYSPMPKGGAKLPQCEIDMVRIWIEEGALNN